MEEASIVEREGGLHKGLTQAQVVMIGLGGAIGTGLFLGSGIAIGYAGPSVLLSYAIAGFIAVVMVFSLSEMAVVHPAAGSFGAYAETYLNPWAGFVVRYTYWFAQVIAVGGEAVAAGVYMTYWFPDSPVWLWSLGFAVDRALRQLPLGEQFRDGRILVRPDQGDGHRAFIVLGLAQSLGLAGLKPRRPAQPLPAARRLLPPRPARHVDGGDHGACSRSTASR